MEAISGPLTGDRTGPLNTGVAQAVVLSLRATSYSVEVLSRVTLVPGPLLS